MPLLIAISVFIFVTAAVAALLQWRTASSVIAQGRLQRAAGQGSFDSYLQADGIALRGNRLSSIKWVERLLSDFDLAKSIELVLIRAAWNMRVSEFLATVALSGAIGLLIGKLLLGHILIGLVLAVFGAYVPVFLLKRAAKKRIKKIEKQLVEMLVMMSNALKAGFGLMQALDQAGRQLDMPIAGEIRQLVRDTQVGSTIEEAVTDFGRRIGSYDLDIVVTAILVQRNVGGNLSEILEGVAHTIRERERIRGEIQTLIAEQKMTGIVIACVPPVVSVVFFVLNKSYMMTLFTTGQGRIALLTAVIMECMGGWMIKKIISIDI